MKFGHRHLEFNLTRLKLQTEIFLVLKYDFMKLHFLAGIQEKKINEGGRRISSVA